MSKNMQQSIESTLAEYAQRLQRVKGMSDSVQQALEKLASALAECAEQLTESQPEEKGAAEERVTLYICFVSAVGDGDGN